ncbi:GGDEF domain-containing protein [Xanthobacter sp. KR7-65]|uniref:GGDEF domain-containing protein n=1 Tax=Xanthobacter sp. KR7-65 TaxID=3156612 RepID=UPI0032B56346
MWGPPSFPELWFYSKISELPYPKTYVGKLLAICFVGTHIPLIAFVGFTAAELDWNDAIVRASILVVLVATVFGTVTALFAIHAMIAPLNVARVALYNYNHHGRLPFLPLDYNDAAGVLMREVNTTISRLDSALAELALEARTDPLTGIGNRRSLMEDGAGAIIASGLSGEPLVLALIDLDDFKGINDRFGHATGDKLLLHVANALREIAGPPHIVGRLGGDEFCVLLKGRSLSEAFVTLDTLRQRIAETEGDLDALVGKVSVSIGAAALKLPGGESLTQLMSRADLELYRAKERGRNCICSESRD